MLLARAEDVDTSPSGGPVRCHEFTPRAGVLKDEREQTESRRDAAFESMRRRVGTVGLADKTLAYIRKVCDDYFAAIHPSNEGSEAAKIELVNRYDALRDRKITLIHGRENITGIAHGIDADGFLLLKTADGPPQRFHAGEVTIAKR